MSKKELRRKIIEFVETQQDNVKDEFYGTDKDIADYVMEQFMAYMGIEE